MSESLEYKGYVGSVHYSDEDEVFHGKLEGLRDLVTYEGTDVRSLQEGLSGGGRRLPLDLRAAGQKSPTCRSKDRSNVRVGQSCTSALRCSQARHGRRS